MYSLLLRSFIFFPALFVMSTLTDEVINDCYAAPNDYGELCVGNGPAVPHPGGLTIGYSIDVVDKVETMVCCKARGWDGEKVIWVELLCDGKSLKGVVPWANSKDQKAIQCKGTPLGAHVKWS
uniref:Secreted protein n=1 Tax=Plectus sambesii TaxID=2011161 RepID=A0A914WU62_9BILA